MKSTAAPLKTSANTAKVKSAPMPRAIPIGAIVAVIVLVPALMTSAFAQPAAGVRHEQAIAQAQQASHSSVHVPSLDEASAAARSFFETIGNQVDRWAEGRAN